MYFDFKIFCLYIILNFFIVIIFDFIRIEIFILKGDCINE